MRNADTLVDLDLQDGLDMTGNLTKSHHPAPPGELLSLEENPWNDAPLQTESWSIQTQPVSGSRQDIKVSTSNYNSGDRNEEDQWGNFETFQRPNFRDTEPSASEDSGMWGNVGTLQHKQQTMQPEQSSHMMGQDAWADAWTATSQEARPVQTLQEPQNRHHSSTGGSWIDSWDAKDDPEDATQAIVQNTIDTRNSPHESGRSDHLSSNVSKAPRDENVLFDAEEDYNAEDDEDFGEFEESSAPEPKQFAVSLLPIKTTGRSTTAQPPLLDLEMDSDFQSWTTPVLSSTRSIPVDLMDDYGDGEAQEAPGISKTNTIKSATVATTSISDDAAWESFEDTLAFSEASSAPILNHTTAASNVAATSIPPLPISLLPILSTPLPPSTSPTPAPMNIPPPSMLLPLFHSYITRSASALFTPLSTLSPDQRKHTTALTALHAYLSLSRTLAHILAGRKHRWKRDTHLQNATHIGPASSAGSCHSSGLKLATVDKAEAAREDREAAETLHLWRQNQVGTRLRSAVLAAGLAAALVPEMAEAMPVRALAAGQGGITAAKACALCGLRREERVARVDVDVMDGFGEWWVEFWGHAGCWGFWEVGKEALVGR